MLPDDREDRIRILDPFEVEVMRTEMGAQREPGLDGGPERWIYDPNTFVYGHDRKLIHVYLFTSDNLDWVYENLLSEGVDTAQFANHRQIGDQISCIRLAWGNTRWYAHGPLCEDLLDLHQRCHGDHPYKGYGLTSYINHHFRRLMPSKGVHHWDLSSMYPVAFQTMLAGPEPNNRHSYDKPNALTGCMDTVEAAWEGAPRLRVDFTKMFANALVSLPAEYPKGLPIHSPTDEVRVFTTALLEDGRLPLGTYIVKIGEAILDAPQSLERRTYLIGSMRRFLSTHLQQFVDWKWVEYQDIKYVCLPDRSRQAVVGPVFNESLVNFTEWVHTDENIPSNIRKAMVNRFTGLCNTGQKQSVVRAQFSCLDRLYSSLNTCCKPNQVSNVTIHQRQIKLFAPFAVSCSTFELRIRFGAVAPWHMQVVWQYATEHQLNCTMRVVKHIPRDNLISIKADAFEVILPDNNGGTDTSRYQANTTAIAMLFRERYPGDFIEINAHDFQVRCTLQEEMESFPERWYHMVRCQQECPTCNPKVQRHGKRKRLSKRGEEEQAATHPPLAWPHGTVRYHVPEEARTEFDPQDEWVQELMQRVMYPADEKLIKEDQAFAWERIKGFKKGTK